MTRKDTILIAVVINAGLLAVLFATAMIYDTDKVLDQNEISGNQLVEAKKPTISEDRQGTLVANAEPTTVDEVDNVLSSFTTPPPQPITVDTESVIIIPEQPTTSFREETPSKHTEATDTNEDQDDFIEVKVKKGDSLDKIARANGTTIEAIKKASELKSEKLKIGQILKVPSKKEGSAKKDAAATKEVAETTDEAVYYTIQSGDSPWKVAKKYKLEYEDILKLNDMDEEKARNLKIGDKIRIK